MSDAYRDAGVDIAAGAEAVERMKAHVRRTHRSEVLGGLGGFGGLFGLDASKYQSPVLVSGADGVGTKLKLAFECDRHDTIGVDAVAMCVNDIAAAGAEPLFFLDYLALGRLVPERVEAIVAGVAEGCVQAGCALIGGETAEMPGLYAEEEYDLAGFAVGVVERDRIVDGRGIRAGDVVLGAPSSGLHSNGFSLVRKLLADRDRFPLERPLADLKDGRSLGEVLLTPTTIYVGLIRALLDGVDLKGLAHITGGGLAENLPRILPEGLGVSVRLGSWPVPAIFSLLRKVGGLTQHEMYRTFNMGIGMAVVVRPEDEGRAVDAAAGAGTELHRIGAVVDREGVSFDTDTRYGYAVRPGATEPPAVKDPIARPDRARRPSRTRVAVLASGSGTNFQALADASAAGRLGGAAVELLVCDRAAAPVIRRAERMGIPVRLVDPAAFRGRPGLDAELVRILAAANVDLVVLAGWMRILGPDVVAAHRNRMINVHPSLLPAFRGMHAVRQALVAGVRVTGATVHLVDEGVDTGRILAQEAVNVLPDDTEASLAARIHPVEHRLLCRAVAELAAGRVP